MLNKKDIMNMAKQAARAMKRGRKPTISKQQQLAEFQRRQGQGIDGFKDIMDQHGHEGLRRYLNAMTKLAKEQK